MNKIFDKSNASFKNGEIKDMFANFKYFDKESTKLNEYFSDK